MLQYGPSAGLAALRDWLAEWQGVKPEQVLTGNGSLELIEFLCTALLKPGDVVFTEAPSYDRAITLFRRHGAQRDRRAAGSRRPGHRGAREAAGAAQAEAVLRDPGFPESLGRHVFGRRSASASWSWQRSHDVLLLEDAPYRMLRYRGTQEPTLFSLAPQRTLHMTSFTKLIAPGVRLGFMIGDAATLAKIGKVAEDTYIAAGLFRARRDARMVEGRQARSADREAQGAVCAAPRGLPGRARQVHSRCRGHAPGWRVLPVADAAAGCFHHRPARSSGEAAI